MKLIQPPESRTGPRLSHYVCPTCVNLIAAVEVDPGVIPAMIGCVFGCGKRMRSIYYQTLPEGYDPVEVTHEFYRPRGAELHQLMKHPGKRGFMKLMDSGELWLRKRTTAKPMEFGWLDVIETTVKNDIKEAKDSLEFFTGVGKPRLKRFTIRRLTLGG